MEAISSHAAARDHLRSLASQVLEAAMSEKMRLIKRRWRDTNDLRKPDRAPVFCRPVGAWSEIIPDDSLLCSEPCARGIEQNLRRSLVKIDIGDDTPLEPFYDVGAALDVEPANRWGVEIGRHAAADANGAWGYDPPLKSFSDLARLRIPTFSHNAAKTKEEMDKVDSYIGDILPPRRRCGLPLSATLGTDAADLIGLTELMLHCAAEPELVHALMAHMRDSCLKALDSVESAGLLTTNHDEAMCLSDPFGPAGGSVSAANLWCFANSQEFDQVSPDMWEEFCLAYQKPILERFGRVVYGCCENLTHKIDGVLSIPNLRVFVCSAWTNLDKLLEKVDPGYVLMWRQKASDVVFPDSMDKIRQDIDAGLRKLKGRNYQIVLRELQTLCGHPRRLHDWTMTAIELAEKHA